MATSATFNTGTSASLHAVSDILEGMRMYPVWSAFGWQDIRQRYQRSVLGPFWITLTMMVTIVGMGPLYAALLRVDATDFIPFLALGLIVWGFISSLVNDGCLIFTGADGMIRSVRLPMTMHALRMIFRNTLMFLHNTMAYVPFAIYLGIQPQWDWFMVIPGIALIIVAAFPVSLILGIFCARFRDMQQIVASVVQLSFFLTPIIWKPELLGSRIAFANYNPFFMFIELVRGPVYGHPPGAGVYLHVGMIIVLLYALAIPVFVRFRRRIAFWV